MPEKLETTHVLMDKTLIVYRRERSAIWQCRFKVDGIWQRASTKERDLDKAKVKADALRISAESRKHDNLPVVTCKFRDIAKLAIERMDEDQKAGKGTLSKQMGTSVLMIEKHYSLEITAVSGHKTLQMLKRYTHLQAEKLATKLG
jgi:hypothetical protein